MFEANLLAGKTEIILRLVGPKAAGVKESLAEAGMKIAFQTCRGQQYVRVVNMYTHLGVNTTAGCSHSTELSHRRSSATHKLGCIASKCFSIESIPIEKKIAIARSHLFSRLLYGAGCWHELS